jgi:hypothetical protein
MVAPNTVVSVFGAIFLCFCLSWFDVFGTPRVHEKQKTPQKIPK